MSSTEEKNHEDIEATENIDYYRVKVIHSSETHLVSSEDPLVRGDNVIISSRYGKDMGVVLGATCKDCQNRSDDPIEVIRKATEQDISEFDKYREKERDALVTCREKVRNHGLDMKLVSAHYLPEESKILFFFTAENRVDFRELVKDLVAVFRMRIELRQIGVRDESRVLGGVAVCGRQYCCHGLTDKLKPVSIKMAKEQNLSLNSMKISGPCGRLLCCLSYEYDFYLEEKKKYPHAGMRLHMNGETYRVCDVNILAKTAQLSTSEGGYIYIPLDLFFRDKKSGDWRFTIPDEEPAD